MPALARTTTLPPLIRPPPPSPRRRAEGPASSPAPEWGTSPLPAGGERARVRGSPLAPIRIPPHQPLQPIPPHLGRPRPQPAGHGEKLHRRQAPEYVRGKPQQAEAGMHDRLPGKRLRLPPAGCGRQGSGEAASCGVPKVASSSSPRISAQPAIPPSTLIAATSSSE